MYSFISYTFILTILSPSFVCTPPFITSSIHNVIPSFMLITVYTLYLILSFMFLVAYINSFPSFPTHFLSPLLSTSLSLLWFFIQTFLFSLFLFRMYSFTSFLFLLYFFFISNHFYIVLLKINHFFHSLACRVHNLFLSFFIKFIF